jgi:aromatic ring hydroxylase
MAAVLAETIGSTGEMLGPMTGRRYVDSLRDGREVWIDGGRVDDVTTHPAFKDMIAELARIYDLQNSDKYRDEITGIDAATGRRISVSWVLPRSAEDLKRKRCNSELWKELSWGQLGRGSDILAPNIIFALHLKTLQRSQASEMRFRRKYRELLQILHKP